MEDSDIDLYGDLDNEIDFENNDFEDFMDDNEIDCNKKSSNNKVDPDPIILLADKSKVNDEIEQPHDDLDDLLNEVFTPKASKSKIELEKDVSAIGNEDKQIDEQLHFINQRNTELEVMLFLFNGLPLFTYP